ncbi:hypothetical protein NL676_008551, partial [Syzygium grande]
DICFSMPLCHSKVEQLATEDLVELSETEKHNLGQRQGAKEGCKGYQNRSSFGLMPFTTMGTKSFVFGKTMENLDEDYEYEAFEGMDGDME